MLLQIIELLLLGPHKNLVQGPCNMGESQHEPVVEIGKAQENPKLSECVWHWTVTYELDLGWIHMDAMLINNVAQVMDHVHGEGAFFQVGI
jgi:hypothetical protein